MDGSRTGKGGILKLDKMRAQESGSCEYRDLQELHAQAAEKGPVSPQPSVDRLSVTWADPELSVSSASTKVNFFHMDEPALADADRFPSSVNNDEGSEEEYYSASISAIMTRRESTRKSRKGRGRRPSSPFVSESEIIPSYRRTSVLTTSSGDSAASMEEGQVQGVPVAQEQIVESIRLHKEFISIVKQEHLAMRKKLKLVRQAKSYIKSNEGQLQERLAQSKNTRDIMAKCNILLASFYMLKDLDFYLRASLMFSLRMNWHKIKVMAMCVMCGGNKWQHMKREAANLSNIMIPWELRIKEIESHFGSVVASYFTFLRWLFWVNLVISFILVVFVIVPEMLTADVQLAGERKVIYEEDKNASTNLLILWEFEGVFKCSPIFYGYYTNVDAGDYRLPLAYFMTGLAVYVYSFVATLKKMAENSRMSKLSEKEDECIFSWKLFTGWDFMIGNAETAHNRTASIILSFKEALLEEEEKKKDPRNWRIISLRILVNLCVVILLAISAFAVVKVVERSNEKSNHWWRQNEITIVMSILSNMFPILFEVLGMLEHYHPRKQLRIQLGRIMLLNLLNIYSLIIALFSKIDGMTTQLENLKPKPNSTLFNETQYTNLNINFFLENSSLLLKPIYENDTHTCYGVVTECKKCEYVRPSSNPLTASHNTAFSPAAFRKPYVNLENVNSSTIIFFNGTINDTTSTESSEYSPAAFRNPSVTIDNVNSSSIFFFNGDISDKISTESSTSPYSQNDDINWYKTNNNRLNYKKKLSNEKAPDENNFSNSNFINRVRKIPIKIPVTYNDSSLSKFTKYIKLLAKNSTVSDDVDDNLEENDYYDYNTVSEDDEDTTTVDQNSNYTNEQSTNPNETLTYNATTNQFENSETDIVNEHSTQYYASVENTINYDNITRSNVYLYSEQRGNEIIPSVTSPFEETYYTDESEISENPSTDFIHTNEIPMTNLKTSSETISQGLISDLPELNGLGSTTLGLDFTFNTTESLVVPTASDNELNTDYSTTVNTIGTLDMDENLYHNLDKDKIKPCYEIKCIKKTSVEYNNGSHIILPSNYSGDLIIEDSHNHQRYNLSKRTKRQLLSLCWETMFGQELVKLTMMDMVLCIVGTLLVDFYRAVFVRYMNRCWCWDLEKKFPQYGDFKIAENILHLVNNQGMVWMGLFFSPGLAVLNLVKLVIMMYLRSWAVMTCNVPHEVVFRASRSNNFYLGLLLIMLFLCVLPVGYAIVWVKPSWHCGPFSDYDRIYHIFTTKLNAILPNKLKKISDYIASPGIVIPLLVLLILVIYYLTSLTNSLREANNDLKAQLRRERTEERRKMFQLADRRRRVGSAEMETTPFERWKKILPNLPPAKSIDFDEKKESADGESNIPLKKKGDIFAKIVSMALRRPLIEEKIPEMKTAETPSADDETDTEFHESLPEDLLHSKNIKKIPQAETIKKRVNVDFLTTYDGKIKEEIVNPVLKHKVKTLLSKTIPAFESRPQITSEIITEKSPEELERRTLVKLKTRDLVKAKILAESMRRKDEDKAKARAQDEASVVDKKIKIKQVSETSTQSRQSDSIGSVIPVITISKTESDDDMLRESGSSAERFEAEAVAHRPVSRETQETNPTPVAGSSKSLRRCASNLKALRRQSSVDSINEQKGSKDKRADEGHKFQYSL